MAAREEPGAAAAGAPSGGSSYGKKEDSAEALARLELGAFLHDPRKIPCFREAMLTGVMASALAGVAAYFRTGRHRSVLNWGYAAFIGTAAVSWPICRYQYTSKRKQVKGFIRLSEEREQKLRERAAEEGGDAAQEQHQQQQSQEERKGGA